MPAVTVDNHQIELSRQDKVLFADHGLTKGDLVEYYRKAADWVLAHAAGRVISMLRYPDGIDSQRFYQKRVPDYFPDWIRTVDVQAEDDTLKQMVLTGPADLVYLANQACITPHIWLSQADQLDTPDRMIFDFDPPQGQFEPVRDAARRLRDLLEELDLPAGVMTTGSKGLHVLVPLQPDWPFDRVRGMAKDTGRVLAARHDFLTLQTRKDQRHGRVFVDYLRNAYGQTAAAPYAVRARPGAPVATPLDWKELGAGKLGPQSYTIKNLFRRMGQRDDPFADLSGKACKLGPARQKLDKLLDEEVDGD
jgi:bifunctional non-homologous end joining protein LigD